MQTTVNMKKKYDKQQQKKGSKPANKLSQAIYFITSIQRKIRKIKRQMVTEAHTLFGKEDVSFL